VARAELARRGADRDEESEKGHSEPTPAERATKRLGFALMVLAFAILLFVLVGAALLGMQLTAMRGQLAQMQAAAHQAEEALQAAGRVADAAKRSADAIPDIERAYLFLDASSSELPKAVAAASPARIAFKNYGKTPATLRGVVGRYYYAPNVVAKMALPQAAMPLSSVVGEGAVAGPYDLPLDANDQDLDQAKKGQGALLVQAAVGYADLFGESHETGVCYAFKFDAGAFVPCPDAALNYHN